MSEVDKIYRDIIADLKANADDKRMLSERHYFKETIRNIGLSTPVLTKVFSPYIKQIKVLEPKDVMALSDKLYHSGIYEAEHLGRSVLAINIKKLNLADVYNLLMKCLDDGVMDNWAIIDMTSAKVMHFCIDDNLSLQKELFKLTKHDNIWHRRISIVGYVMHAKYGNYLDTVYKTAEELLSDEEDLIHKAVGWVLRQSWYADPDRLLKFIAKHGKNMSRTTLRYAIEKLPVDERKKILADTK